MQPEVAAVGARVGEKSGVFPRNRNLLHCVLSAAVIAGDGQGEKIPREMIAACSLGSSTEVVTGMPVLIRCRKVGLPESDGPRRRQRGGAAEKLAAGEWCRVSGKQSMGSQPMGTVGSVWWSGPA